MSLELNKNYNEDCLSGLKKIDPKSIHCCVTSPPYYGLRDYGIPPTQWPSVTFSLFGMPITVPEQTCCLGLEKTPMDFVAYIVLIFRGVRECLRDDGTLWLNFGDSYCGTGTGSGTQKSSTLQGGKATQIEAGKRPSKKSVGTWIKSKDLLGIPWMVAFALRDDGWYLRQDIIWHKPSVMPESVNDRCTKSHEYIFLLSKSKQYYFDAEAIAEASSPNTHAIVSQDIQKQVGSFRANGGNKTNGPMKACPPKYKQEEPGSGNRNNKSFNGALVMPVERRNKRSVWSVSNKGHGELHFASYPEELIVDCIKAGCPEEGIVLDPFMGSGTTGLVARKLNRNFIGFDLNPEYMKIQDKRMDTLGMFK